MARIYLDNAATSWPKPAAVYHAVDVYQRENGAPAGRSGYAQASLANRIVEQARRGVAELIGERDPRQIIFTCSGTDSLNLAIRGVVRPGDHVVTTVCEHNSVLRPLRALADETGIEVTYVSCDATGVVSPRAIRDALRPNTRVAAVIHASNVTGAIQPIEDIGSIVRRHGALFLVDAAQSLGHVPIDVASKEMDLLAAPGHKGLLGPLGVGVLWMRPGVEDRVRPLRYGGTGTQSNDEVQPSELPDRFEPGNHNVPGLAGLAAATAYLKQRTIADVAAHHQRLTGRLLEALREIDGLTIYGPQTVEQRVSVVSVTLDGYDPQELAVLLEASHGVQCRAGLHCAPRMHAELGTTAGGGTLRLSPGAFTTDDEIDAAAAALRDAAAVALR